MNDGSPTLLNTRNTLTAVDVSMANAELASTLNWSCPAQSIAGDHFPIFITNTGPKYLKKVEKRFQERKANWDLFKRKNDILHHQFEQTRNVNKEAAQIKKIIRKSSNESMPLNQPLKQKETPIWFNSEISKLVILKNKAWQKFKAKKTPVTSLNYKKISAQVRRACKQAKKETWTCFVNSLNPTLDTKTIWTKVKKIKSSKTLDFPPIFENNDILSHPEVIAEKFANLWSSIASNDNFSPQLIHEKTQINFSNVCDNNNTNGIMNEVTLIELNLTLQRVKGKTPGKDKITYSMIKNASSIIKNRLCELYSEILRTGTYPHNWKHATLTPIPKAGKNQNSTEGYRPISLITVLAKILDKIITQRLWKVYGHNIHASQHAYKAGHGVHTLCHLLEANTKTCLGNQNHNVIVSEDIEKAFDRVISTHVIKELNIWGVPQMLLKLILSFLSHRRITVKVDGYFSRPFTLNNGIPQGSPLSVFLFSAYTNTLSKLVNNTPGVNFIGIYADNIFALVSGAEAEVQQNLNNLDRKIQNWANMTGAVIPANKIEALHICRKRSCHANNITIRNTTITLQSNMRILGVTFTRNALWNDHVKNIVNKLSKVHNVLKIICTKKKGPHMDTALAICRSLAEGAVQHCVTLYGWTSEANKSKINTAMNNCFRTASGLLISTPLDATRVEACFKDFDWLLNTRSINMAAKALTSPAHALHKEFWNVINKNQNKEKINRSWCSIRLIATKMRSTNIPIPAKPIEQTTARSKLMIDISLSRQKKSNTNAIIYQQAFLEYKNRHAPDITIYTDGSLVDETATYAVVEQNSKDEYKVIHESLLPPNAGIHNAELAAIRFAAHHAATKHNCALICTDSLSVAVSLLNENSEQYTYLTNGLPGQANITVLWIPGHSGIKGNELADDAAKNASKLPLISEAPCLRTIITNYYKKYVQENENQKWSLSESFLSKHNTGIDRPKYNPNLSRTDCIIMARMRVGVTKFSSQHYFQQSWPLECAWCSTILSVEHILKQCPVSGDQNINLTKALDCSQESAMKILKDALSVHNLLHEV